MMRLENDPERKKIVCFLLLENVGGGLARRVEKKTGLKMEKVL